MKLMVFEITLLYQQIMFCLFKAVQQICSYKTNLKDTIKGLKKHKHYSEQKA